MRYLVPGGGRLCCLTQQCDKGQRERLAGSEAEDGVVCDMEDKKIYWYGGPGYARDLVGKLGRELRAVGLAEWSITYVAFVPGCNGYLQPMVSNSDSLSHVTRRPTL